ncbi:NACHT domain-containing NTPase [Methyloceanibacter sp. wino2]|uniref:NACHT domain-containing protein n=1 Tax=Methyloceanibacter sp. wino2 TaxID=2170729 RepID=UPI00131F3FEF|nr:hypothetical protein [Methyloceanibacter sp. wino2]
MEPPALSGNSYFSLMTATSHIDHRYLPRHLTSYDERGNRLEIVDAELPKRMPPIVVLGEPGMGKTWLLEQLAKHSGTDLIRAPSFVRSPQRFRPSDPMQVLVIDALDEVAALQEGDPLHNVLRALGTIGWPPFILSCRAADWQHTVDSVEIADDYGRKPEEWTLEPIAREEALRFLVHGKVDQASATNLIEQLEEKGLAELYGNPLTLDLLAKLTQKAGYSLPNTRAALYEQAVEVLRLEPNPRYVNSELARLPKLEALDAAGATMAAWLMTGKDAISIQDRIPDTNNDLPIAEVTTLPHSKYSRSLLHSRLFRSARSGESRFLPFHRTVAEYLGARWLAEQAKGNSRVMARLFALITVDGLVPASLRGLHAWLAHFDEELATTVIANDPYGLLRYGDADGLTFEQGRELLKSLRRLEQEDPYFRAGDWGSHSAKGLIHTELADDVREAITSEFTGYHLRTLLLEVIKDTPMAVALKRDLKGLLSDTTLTYAERADAGEALVSIARDTTDWPTLCRELCQLPDHSSARLSLSLMRSVGVEHFAEGLIAEAILAHLDLSSKGHRTGETVVAGLLYGFPKLIPIECIPSLLDHLADGVIDRRERSDDVLDRWESRSELSGFSQELIVRYLAQSPLEPVRLWRWLDSLIRRVGYDHDDKDEIARYFRSHSEDRQSIQNHMLFSGDVEAPRFTSYFWGGPNSFGLRLQQQDILVHLEELSARHERSKHFDEVWRDLVSASRTDKGVPDEVRLLAQSYASGDKQLLDFLDPRETAQSKRWRDKERKWEEKRKRRELRDKARKLEQRAEFAAHELDLRSGELQWVAPSAKAYFGLFADINNEKEPPERIGDWLGEELQGAALAGFEATLFRKDLPTPQQVANSYADGKFWHFIHPIMAGLAERWRNGRGFEDIPVEVVMTGRIGIAGDLVQQSGSMDGFEEALDGVLRSNPPLFETFLRTWFEPHFLTEHQHITGLYQFARDATYRPLSTQLSAEWLERFSNISRETEHELVQCLATAPGPERDFAWSALRSIAEMRLSESKRKTENQRLWQSVCFLVSFEQHADWVSADKVLDPDFIWSIRSIVNIDRWDRTAGLPISANQLAWIVRSFRSLWPKAARPSGVTGGDTNSWDATKFLEWAIYRLANDTSQEAGQLLDALVEEVEDDYSEQLRSARAMQRRARMEDAFLPAKIDQLVATLNDEPPSSAQEVQAIALDSISRLQKKIKGSATDTRDRFYDDAGKPRTENDCRDLLLDLLHLPFGIQTSPEEAMPKKKRSDAGFRLGTVRVPLEAKGQWNKDVWTGMSSQLSELYAIDHMSDGRGIYLVFWFGRNAPPGKRLKRPPKGLPSPESAEQMQTMLARELPKGQRDSIAIFVLDLDKEPDKQ